MKENSNRNENSKTLNENKIDIGFDVINTSVLHCICYQM